MDAVCVDPVDREPPAPVIQQQIEVLPPHGPRPRPRPLPVTVTAALPSTLSRHPWGLECLWIGLLPIQTQALGIYRGKKIIKSDSDLDLQSISERREESDSLTTDERLCTWAPADPGRHRQIGAARQGRSDRVDPAVLSLIFFLTKSVISNLPM